MKRISDDDREHAAVVHLAVVRVTVAPEHELLEDEEEQDAGEQRRKYIGRRKLLERFRQQDEQRHTEQGADRVADQPWNESGARRIVDEEKTGGDDQASQAAKQAQPEGNEERGHAAGS